MTNLVAVEKQMEDNIGQDSNSSFQAKKVLEEYQRNKELRIVMVGKTGKGKSATANTILGKKVFDSNSLAKSVTQNCQIAKVSRLGRDVMIVDTPGFCDTSVEVGEIEKEVQRVVPLCSPGIHAFVIILSLERYTEEEQKATDAIVNAFGKELYNYTIVVFTHLDNLERDDITIDTFVLSASVPLKKLLANCRNQYTAINNSYKYGSKEREQEAENLLKYIFDVLKKNDHKYYNNKMFEAAEKNVKIKIPDKIQKAVEEAEARKKEYEEKLEELEKKRQLEMERLEQLGELRKQETNNEIQQMKLEMERIRSEHRRENERQNELTETATRDIIRERDELREKEANRWCCIS